MLRQRRCFNSFDSIGVLQRAGWFAKGLASCCLGQLYSMVNVSLLLRHMYFMSCLRWGQATVTRGPFTVATYLMIPVD